MIGRLAILGLAVAALPATAHAQVPVEIVLHPDLVHLGPSFEGWGTALAWSANVTGRWSEAERERLADLFYGKDGLRWNIARYNIGGGNPEGTKSYMRPGAAIEGYWRRPADATATDWWNPDDPQMWNWSADAGQRWWLGAVRQRVANPIFEAFSNSPPWFMTVSGRVSGAKNGTEDNLKPGKEKAFAEYLARVVGELQQREGIAFRTLSPVNEPDTDYWHLTNRQEGSHWSPQRQAMMIDATFAALHRHGLSTVVAAPDETSSQLFRRDWAGYPPETRAKIGQLNVHSYGTQWQTAVRDIARGSGIRLWMSENDTPGEGDPENFDAMSSPLAFAEHVVKDLKRLEPSAWVFWQAVETISAHEGQPGTNWGLVKADLSAPADMPHDIKVTRKYWAMAQFSRYIRPGYHLVRMTDPDSAGALSPDGNTLVVVHVNGGPLPRKLKAPVGWYAALIVTDAGHEAACISGTTAPPESIDTLVLTKRKEELPCQ